MKIVSYQVYLSDTGLNASHPGQFCPSETSGRDQKWFWLSQLGDRRNVTGIYWVEVQDLAKHSPMYRTPALSKVYLPPKVKALVETSSRRTNHKYSSLAGNKAFTTHTRKPTQAPNYTANPAARTEIDSMWPAGITWICPLSHMGQRQGIVFTRGLWQATSFPT